MSDKESETEGLIKEAARKLFHEKGFAGTKTRDIAEAAQINLALLNYYFRSKKKLYDIIMMESIQHFFSDLVVVINNAETNFLEKLQELAIIYIDMLSQNPDIANFILNEVRQHPDQFTSKLGALEMAKNSVFLKQYTEAVKEGVIPPVHPAHFLMNFAGLVVFPFIVTPMVSVVTGLPRTDLIELIQERKRLVPLWIQSMLQVK
ncbi:TetR/AcrR family transcriptional regulator [Portibacter lacus]|uniref:TetR family transcriptional regulator n=1 Tax=Portibacter lacus TaxID=1099794 RepID=A0AA37WE35_9BACT|nr:TetR/AcrR family transcriptional regulator [Portibacter lacus]GLR15750.1 TetR family transcriptional regulator [Portibacter lacus]